MRQHRLENLLQRRVGLVQLLVRARQPLLQMRDLAEDDLVLHRRALHPVIRISRHFLAARIRPQDHQLVVVLLGHLLEPPDL